MSEIKEKVSNFIHDDYFYAAATGNLERFDMCLKSVENVDVTDCRGWTALMFASKNGHSNIVKNLLEKNCDPKKLNITGQTAQDMAEFWLHGDIVNLLSNRTEGQQKIRRKTNYLCDNPLDRSSQKRIDDVWIKKALKSSSSTFIVFSGLRPLVYFRNQGNKDGADTFLPNINHINVEIHAKLARFKYENVLKLSPNLFDFFIFLGRELNELENKHEIKSNNSQTAELTTKEEIYNCWFAVETKLSTSEIQQIDPGLKELPFPLGFSSLMRFEASIACQARSMMAWHDRNQFCATCGSPSLFADAGYKRQCSNNLCRSNKGAHNTCYPRVDPTVIMAISCPENKRILLGRNKKRHIPNMWSVLAGFMEPGESIEEACRREVFEETQINVGDVIYHSSQPWPMPSTLMIGCLGQAIDSNIVIDESELSEARWFCQSEIKQMLTNTHPERLILPPPQAIAHQLILHWLSSAAQSPVPSPTSQQQSSSSSPPPSSSSSSSSPVSSSLSSSQSAASSSSLPPPLLSSTTSLSSASQSLSTSSSSSLISKSLL